MNKILLVLFLTFSILATAQNNCEKYTDKYIPIDLNDAIYFFECKWPKEDLDNFKNKEENTATTELHSRLPLFAFPLPASAEIKSDFPLLFLPAIR